MNVTPRVARRLQSLPEEDARAVIDVAERAAQGTSRRLITTSAVIGGLDVRLTIGRPVANSFQDHEPVLLALAVATRQNGGAA